MNKSKYILPLLIKELKTDKTEFAKMVGTTPQQINNYISRDVEIKNKFANKIIKAYPKININFLMSGEMPLFKGVSDIPTNNKDDTSKLIELLKKENEILREKVTYYEQREQTGAITENHSSIPVINTNKRRKNDKG